MMEAPAFVMRFTALLWATFLAASLSAPPDACEAGAGQCTVESEPSNLMQINTASVEERFRKSILNSMGEPADPNSDKCYLYYSDSKQVPRTEVGQASMLNEIGEDFLNFNMNDVTEDVMAWTEDRVKDGKLEICVHEENCWGAKECATVKEVLNVKLEAKAFGMKMNTKASIQEDKGITLDVSNIDMDQDLKVDLKVHQEWVHMGARTAMKSDPNNFNMKVGLLTEAFPVLSVSDFDAKVAFNSIKINAPKKSSLLQIEDEDHMSGNDFDIKKYLGNFSIGKCLTEQVAGYCDLTNINVTKILRTKAIPEISKMVKKMGTQTLVKTICNMVVPKLVSVMETLIKKISFSDVVDMMLKKKPIAGLKDFIQIEAVKGLLGTTVQLNQPTLHNAKGFMQIPVVVKMDDAAKTSELPGSSGKGMVTTISQEMMLALNPKIGKLMTISMRGLPGGVTSVNTGTLKMLNSKIFNKAKGSEAMDMHVVNKVPQMEFEEGTVTIKNMMSDIYFCMQGECNKDKKEDVRYDSHKIRLGFWMEEMKLKVTTLAIGHPITVSVEKLKLKAKPDDPKALGKMLPTIQEVLKDAANNVFKELPKHVNTTTVLNLVHSKIPDTLPVKLPAMFDPLLPAITAVLKAVKEYVGELKKNPGNYLDMTGSKILIKNKAVQTIVQLNKGTKGTMVKGLLNYLGDGFTSVLLKDDALPKFIYENVIGVHLKFG